MIIFISRFSHCQQKWSYFRTVHIAGANNNNNNNNNNDNNNNNNKLLIIIHRVFPWILSVIDIHCYHFYKVSPHWLLW